MKYIFSFSLLFYLTNIIGQTSDKTYYEKYPKTVVFSADSIKEINVYIVTNKQTESDYDTIIKVDSNLVKAFIIDLNKNHLLSRKTYFNQHYENKVCNRHIKRFGRKSYSIELVSISGNSIGFYIYANLIGIAVGDNKNDYKMFSNTGQLGLFYQLKTKNILQKYKIVI